MASLPVFFVIAGLRAELERMRIIVREAYRLGYREGQGT